MIKKHITTTIASTDASLSRNGGNYDFGRSGYSDNGAVIFSALWTSSELPYDQIDGRFKHQSDLQLFTVYFKGNALCHVETTPANAAAASTTDLKFHYE